MCSNVAGLINGPVGNLVAMGVRALIDGASPVGPKSAEALKRQNKTEGVREFYDGVEAHLRGTLRVLQPAVEIKNVLMGECRSAGNERSASNNETPMAYYTPQNAKKSSRVNNCYPVRCCGSAKKSTDRSVLPRTAESRSHSCGPSQSSTPQRNGDCSSVDDKSCSTNKCRRNDTSKSFLSPRDTSAKSDRAASGRTTRNKTSSTKAVRACHACDAHPMDDMLVVLPCKHLFCYPCLARGKYPRCQKCDKSFDMKNVTSL